MKFDCSTAMCTLSGIISLSGMFVVDDELIVRTLTHLSVCESSVQRQNKRKTEWHKSHTNKAMILLDERVVGQKETRNTRVLYVNVSVYVLHVCVSA